MNNQVLNELTDESSLPLLTNVTFSGNTANIRGGAMPAAAARAESTTGPASIGNS